MSLAASSMPVAASRGVFVLGMHRSGTSAAVRLISLLGIPFNADDDLLEPDDANPKGYWESASLKAFNDELLEALGCQWNVPPPVPMRWNGAGAAGFAARARQAFGAHVGGGDWVWKDPRNCITLPFWLRAFDVDPTIVFVFRNPLEVAGSLGRRDGLEKRRGLGLWERYVRHSLAAAAGLPTLVTSYGELMRDPVAWSQQAHEFLARRGFKVHEAPADGVADFVDPALRRVRVESSQLEHDPDVSRSQAALFDVLEGLKGPHAALAVPRLPAETESLDFLFAQAELAELAELRRHADALERSLADVFGSRTYRYTAPVRWLAGRLGRSS